MTLISNSAQLMKVWHIQR